MKAYRNLFLKGVLLISLLTILSACGGGNPEPPYFGAFLVDANELIELEQGTAFGVPSFNDLNGVPIAPDSQPVVLLWQPNTQLQYLQFFSIRPKEELDYTASPNDEGVLELQPRAALNPGRYCFIQGDPLGMGLPMWCFEIAGEEGDAVSGDEPVSSEPSVDIPIANICEISSNSPTTPFEGVWVNEAMDDNIDLVGFQICLDSEIMTEDGDRWPVITIDMWGEGLRNGSATITVIIDEPVTNNTINVNSNDTIVLLDENTLRWNEPDSASRNGVKFVRTSR
ncbi:hypothetical protein [Candidatus Leptofilum sp.]|uniref:hypothetical protein n=1 Tax=Candidatus Leptofilum sp. TaxID=3241576 RepID=UPI003B5ACFA0